MSRLAAALVAALVVVVSATGCTRRLQVDRPVPADDPSDAWAALLDEATSPDGVDYDRIADDRIVLDDFMAWVGAHGPRRDSYKESKEDEALSFLINAYNAAVVYGVLANRSPGGEDIGSVRDLRFSIWRTPGSGFFMGQRFYIDGEWVSLHHLEQEMIVNRYQEPLVHAALTCASAGCPELRWYRARRLQFQLEQAMRAFLATDRGLAPVEGGGWSASPLFSWYRDDFLDWSDAATLCEWMVPYTRGERRAWLESHAEDCPLRFHDYDWRLNAAPTSSPDGER